MLIELKVPAVGESITEVEVGQWLKKEGDPVKKDENIVIIESEKATVELPAPASGTMGKILKAQGETAKVGDTLGLLEPGERKSESKTETRKPAADQSKPAAKVPEQPVAREMQPTEQRSEPAAKSAPKIMPAAQRVLSESKLPPEQVQPTGPGGRLLKEDVLRTVEQGSAMPPAAGASASPVSNGDRQEEVVRMSRLRRTVAERLVAAHQNAALLTTFNEIDMASVMALRKEAGEAFQKKYNVKLGFMSFFVKAVVDSLKLVPELNAEVRGTEIIFKNYFDIGVAIGGGKGLVVPVLRNAERLSFAEIEKAIGDFAVRAKDSKLKIEELEGGTFTISNGGVYGSLLSTPIVNPPQSGVLGMHTIQERPVAREGQVVIRPMMYVALTYDHRIVDGREAVAFLKRIKETIENPSRMLIEV
jgi:2-oxoglutarate dehydrogenase E2 component (dihydrolipoamide succinyltransferase)